MFLILRIFSYYIIISRRGENEYFQNSTYTTRIIKQTTFFVYK